MKIETRGRPKTDPSTVKSKRIVLRVTENYHQTINDITELEKIHLSTILNTALNTFICNRAPKDSKDPVVLSLREELEPVQTNVTVWREKIRSVF